MHPARRNQHIPALDGIRGLAVLLVIIFHCMHMEHAGNALDTQIYRMSAACWCGVDLFFVLSGFLITGILIDAKEGRHSFRNFYARRVLRIFPLYYGLLLFKLLIVPMIAHAPAGSHHADIWYWLYVSNWAQGLGAKGLHPGLGLTWTLAIEEQFYMFWPLIVFCCGRKTLLKICAAMVVAAVLFRVTIEMSLHLPMGHELTPARIDSLAMGAMAAILLREIDLATLHRFARVALAGGAVILAMIFAKDGLWAGPGLMNMFGLTAWGMVFAGMVIFAATLPAERSYTKALMARPLLWLGKFSYAIYLFHATIDGVLQRVAFGAKGSPPRIWGSQLPAQFGYYIVLLALCLAAGWISWNIYEKWFLRLKRYFVYEPTPALHAPAQRAGSASADGCAIGAGIASAEADPTRQTERSHAFLTSPPASAAG
jgi:peptidoglycan/LPS O-acetylase OafA/YrhL